MKLKELSEVEILIMKSIWKLGDDITAYDIIEYLKDHYDRDYARSTVKTYIAKLKDKGFLEYREEQMRKMKDFWHDGSVKEMFQTLTKTITPEEKEELQDLIDDLD